MRTTRSETAPGSVSPLLPIFFSFLSPLFPFPSIYTVPIPSSFFFRNKKNSTLLGIIYRSQKLLAFCFFNFNLMIPTLRTKRFEVVKYADPVLFKFSSQSIVNSFNCESLALSPCLVLSSTGYSLVSILITLHQRALRTQHRTVLLFTTCMNIIVLYLQ